MQNKFLYQVVCLGAFLFTTVVYAQTPGDSVTPEASTSQMAIEQSSENTPDLSNRQTVDFPARTSLDSMELTPLPGIYETDITGPAPLAASVSAKDMPSERLIGVLTPDVFKEMAELERDNTFLKLQILKEDNKNKLETLRANYRQSRLSEISKREEVVRERIRWWQEQEKIRQDLENQQAALEASKLAQLVSPVESETNEEASKANKMKQGEEDDEEDEEKEPDDSAKTIYTLINITGTRGSLNARLKNEESGRTSVVQIGDKLTDGSIVESILPTQVILNKDGEKIALLFNDV